MAITTLAGAAAGVRPDIIYSRNHAGTAGVWVTLWTGATEAYPGASGTYDTTLNGVTCDVSTTGAIPFTNSNNTHLAKITTHSLVSTAPEGYFLFDRLWHNGNIDETVVASPQAIVSPTWPARDMNGSTNGEGVFLALEISATVGAGTPTITCAYTNSVGTAGRSADNVDPTAAARALGAMHMIGLQAGDTGVRSVQSIDFSATWTSGTTNLVAFRPITVVEAVATGHNVTTNIITLAMPRIYDSSCLYFCAGSGSSTVDKIQARIVLTQG